MTIDIDEASAIFELRPSVMVPLTNQDTKKTFVGSILELVPSEPGPREMHEVSEIAKQRWVADLDYRPKMLDGVADVLDAFVRDEAEHGEPSTLVEGNERSFYTVNPRDSLSAICEAEYGDEQFCKALFSVNWPLLLYPDEIFAGQELVMPTKAKLQQIDAARKGE